MSSNSSLFDDALLERISNDDADGADDDDDADDNFLSAALLDED
jgi:hypothetical protein